MRLALAAAAVALGACGHAQSHLDIPPEPPDLETDGGHAAQAAGQPLVLSVDGRDRTVRIHVPPEAGAAMPLVLNLHGSRFTAEQQETFSGMDATADAHGFAVAYPQAAIPAGHGFEWHLPGQPLFGGRDAPVDAPDDVKFIGAAVEAIAHRVPVDPKRIFVAGFSGGARMASVLACALPDTFAGLAAVGGLRFPATCSARRAVPVVAFHGTADPVNPYEGGGSPTWTYGVREAAEQWAAHDGCSGRIDESEPAPTAHLTRYTGCREGSAVDLYAIDATGHEWPGGPPMPEAVTSRLGPQTKAVDANTLIWTFFSAHPR